MNINKNIQEEYNKICVVIVTYGNRAHLACQVIEQCFREKIKKVIVINNNSDKQSKNKITALSSLHTNKLKIISLKENSGSAGGFKKGLQEFYKENAFEYVLLLDDDNLPDTTTIYKLLKNFLSLSCCNKLTAVHAFRKANDINTSTQIESYILPRMSTFNKNSFLGFNLSNIFRKILPIFYTKRICTILNSNKEISLNSAPFGTLFFHKSLLDKIGYPKEELYLYMDDVEFTNRIKKNNGEIYLIPNAIVHEIDKSTWNPSHRFFNVFMYLENTSLPKVFFAIRNTIFFEHHIINNANFNTIRTVNKFAYLSILLFGALFLRKLNTYWLILKAIHHGENRIFENNLNKI